MAMLLWAMFSVHVYILLKYYNTPMFFAQWPVKVFMEIHVFFSLHWSKQVHWKINLVLRFN